LAQYFTPPEVADFIADLINIQPHERVIDPACGEADLLLAANRQAKKKHGKVADVYGVDISFEVVIVARGRFRDEGLEPERITQGDTLLGLPGPQKMLAGPKKKRK
jgi:type I restriction enzyme M protein